MHLEGSGGPLTTSQFFRNFSAISRNFPQFSRNFSQLDSTPPDRNFPPPPCLSGKGDGKGDGKGSKYHLKRIAELEEALRKADKGQRDDGIPALIRAAKPTSEETQQFRMLQRKVQQLQQELDDQVPCWARICGTLRFGEGEHVRQVQGSMAGQVLRIWFVLCRLCFF